MHSEIADRSKGGGFIEDTVLFGKYQIMRVLGKGRTGVVYLAFHRELEEYRAVKQIGRGQFKYEEFRREALMMKELKHPGMPIIYDLEEDAEYFYLIEEYLEGESLRDLIDREGSQSPGILVQYGLEITHLVLYMHSHKPIPILHLDLQPKNLLLCRDGIKLIDFGHSASVTDANMTSLRFGTIGFAAPEVLSGQKVDERSDIFSIGVILYYLGTGRYPEKDKIHFPIHWGKELTTLIRKCLSRDPKARYQSAAELQTALIQFKQHGTGEPQLSLLIGVASIRHGNGATHLALGFSEYLKRHHYSIVYQEKNLSGDMQSVRSQMALPTDQYGLIYPYGIPCSPFYGEPVRLPEKKFDICIRDYGADWKTMTEADVDEMFFIAGGNWWDIDAVMQMGEWVDKGRACLLFARKFPLKQVVLAARPIFDQCYRIPEYSNPFSGNRQSDRFFEMLLEKLKMRKRQEKRKWLSP